MAILRPRKWRKKSKNAILRPQKWRKNAKMTILRPRKWRKNAKMAILRPRKWRKKLKIAILRPLQGGWRPSERGGMMSYIEKMQKEYEIQKAKAESLSEQIHKAPNGMLSVNASLEKAKWYYCEDGGRRRYLPKSEINLAQALAVKKYMQLEQDLAKNRAEAAAAYIRKINTQKEAALAEFLSNPVYSELLWDTKIGILPKQLRQWQDADYRRNDYCADQLKYKVNASLTVRSKSEVLIARSLDAAGIPFRYECALELRDTIIYPDFTLRHPKTGITVYWEHFGLADDRGYIENTQKKLCMYLQNGYIPTINLITTWETREAPLDLIIVEQIVRNFLDRTESLNGRTNAKQSLLQRDRSRL